jgi:alpha-D-ribose 1-methylphosphonate 5-triphosphate synthase subunit PhnL
MIDAPSLDSTTMIAARSVGKAFVLHPQGGVRLPVLTSVDLDVDAGECVALAGPSGAGKSTLLRCLYANYGPSHGTVWVRHNNMFVDLTNASPHEVIEVRTHTIGWVSQFLRVIPRVPTLDIVAEPLTAQGHSLADGRERAAHLLRRLNVPERLWMLAPATFSGGEQQRVNVARGLSAAHPILLVDEPTASLDPTNRDVVIELLNEACAAGSAVVGIFHDAEVRQRIASRTFLLSPLDYEPSEDLAS